MKRIYMNKHWGGIGCPDNARIAIEEVVKPTFDSFHNVSYLKKIEGTPEYGMTPTKFVFKVNNSNTRYLVMLPDFRNSWAGWGYPSSIFSQWIYDLDEPYSAAFPYTSEIHRESYRATGSDGNKKTGYELYYITDENNNLKVFWEINGFGNYYYTYPTVFVTTVTGREGVIIFRGALNQPVFFYLDDPYNAPYYIILDYHRYTEVDKVVMMNYLPIRTGGGVTDQIVDIVESKMVRIYNTGLLSYMNNGINADSPSVRKLIKIDDKYYRQLCANWWYEDPKRDEAVTYIVDSNDPNYQQ